MHSERRADLAVCGGARTHEEIAGLALRHWVGVDVGHGVELLCVHTTEADGGARSGSADLEGVLVEWAPDRLQPVDGIVADDDDMGLHIMNGMALLAEVEGRGDEFLFFCWLLCLIWKRNVIE